MKNAALSLSILLLTSACASAPEPAPVSAGPQAATASESDSELIQAVLTQQDAIARAAQLRDIHYDLRFVLDAEGAEFTGKAKIRFRRKIIEPALRLDFQGGTVKYLSINGKPMTADVEVRPSFIRIKAEQLRFGPNEIEIDFTRTYSRTGDGLHRFKDPEDGRVYLYTHLEPFAASQVFPCFDQPDLKATYSLEVEAPAEWEVVTAVQEARTSIAGSGRKLWKFPFSPRFSTYLFSLIAGPYQVWKGGKAGGIPMRLFARRSLAKYVRPEEWFQVTSDGLRYFEKYFDRRYPFAKYDQVIVPEFNSGAMENVAAVTFSERFVHRGEPTVRERFDLASTILHEMAHMWFGNLVTMKWWNDLWLNESFATYMASLAAAEATPYGFSWAAFHADEKGWAYWEDQLVTTHPIEAEVADTSEAFANFDGITYGKGASVLKQLAYFLGQAKFRDGVRRYFKEHAYGNTELKDFMAALSAASKVDLAEWTREWLRTAGLNSVEARFECQGGRISLFRLHQGIPTGNPGADPIVRTHRAQVALLKNGAGVVHQTSAAVTLREEASVPELVGQDCPAIVYPNHEDHDYVKVKLDPESLAATKKGISMVGDSLLRLQLWTSLWEMVRDAELPLREYLEIVYAHLPKERELLAYQEVASTLASRADETAMGYLPPKAKAERQALELFLAKSLAAAEPGSDFQKIAFDRYIRAASTSGAQRALAGFLKSDDLPKKLTLDQDRRWAIVHRLSMLGHPECLAFAQSELKRDPTDKGARMALASEASRPELKIKQKWFAELLNPDSERSHAELKSVMRSLFPREQGELHEAFAERFYRELPTIVRQRELEFAAELTESLVPATCDPDANARLRNFIAANSSLPHIVLKELKVALQEDDRCLRIRARR